MPSDTYFTQKTTISVSVDLCEIGSDTPHWMLPHLSLISEILNGLGIIFHSAMCFWISSVMFGPLSQTGAYYDVIRAEQIINGVILPFLM